MLPGRLTPTNASGRQVLAVPRGPGDLFPRSLVRLPVQGWQPRVPPGTWRGCVPRCNRLASGVKVGRFGSQRVIVGGFGRGLAAP